jgi:hypothetical protein
MLRIGPGGSEPIAYFAAGNRVALLRALRTASFNAGPQRSLAKIRPLGPIRNVAGIARIEYVSPAFWPSTRSALVSSLRPGVGDFLSDSR